MSAWSLKLAGPNGSAGEGEWSIADVLAIATTDVLGSGKETGSRPPGAFGSPSPTILAASRGYKDRERPNTGTTPCMQ